MAFRLSTETERERANRIIYHARSASYGGVTLSRDDWEWCLEYWPCIYLKANTSYDFKLNWVQRLLKFLKLKTYPTRVDFYNNVSIDALMTIQNEMREKRAMIIDGMWIKVEVV